MNIGKRLFLSYLFIAGLVLLFAIGANVVIGRVNQEFAGLELQTTELIPALKELRFEATEVTASLMEHLLFSALHERLQAGGPKKADEHPLLEEAEEELRRFREIVATYETTFERYAAFVAKHFAGEEGFAVGLRKAGNRSPQAQACR